MTKEQWTSEAAIEQEAWFDPTPLQQAYLVGRESGLLTSGKPISTQIVYSVETKVEPALITKAFHSVVAKQDALRMVFNRDGKAKVLNTVPIYEIPLEDISEMDKGEQDAYLNDAFEKMKELKMDVFQWPLFQSKIYKKEEKNYEMFFLIDMLIADGLSMRILASEIARALSQEDDATQADHGFTEYCLKRNKARESRRFVSSRKYWMDKAPNFPSAPQLPAGKEGSSGPAFGRISGTIKAAHWKDIKAYLKEKGVTPSAHLLALYGRVLEAYSNEKRFVINMPVFSKKARSPRTVGDFTSILLYTMEPNDMPAIEKSLQIQAELLKDMRNVEFDGVLFMRELAKEKPDHRYDIVFTAMLHKAFEDGMDSFGRINRGYSQTSQVTLDCQLYEEQGDLIINFDYNRSMLDGRIVSSMLELFRIHTERIMEKSESSLLLDNDRQFYDTVNHTEKDLRKTTLTRVFKDTAERCPEKIAIRENGESTTYKQLDRMSDQVADYLIADGIRRQDRVLSRGKSTNAVINILGILKAGGTFVPVDTNFPEERVNRIQSICGADIVLNDEETQEYISKGKAGADANLEQRQSYPDDMAYIIFTSGSTGNPKGVTILHHSAVNTIQDVNSRYGIKEEDRILNVSSISFDLSIYDIFGAFACGGTLVLGSHIRDTGKVVDELEKEEITVWNSVPSIMNLVTDYLDMEEGRSGENQNFYDTFISDDNGRAMRIFSLKQVLLSGDFIPLKLPDAVKRHFPAAKVHSLGGATEASIWSICYPIESVDPAWTTIPYGYPMVNQRFYVLNAHDALCPVGVKGELCIGGDGVAAGYFGDADKSEKAFFEHETLGRLYRTGDSGLLSPEGYFEIKGRLDNQIKLNGYRIEIDEIVANMEKVPGVERAVVVLNKQPLELRGFYTAAGRCDVNTILSSLAKHLPRYMIPKVLVQIEAIPLTGNGKIDEKALLGYEQNAGPSKNGKPEKLTATEKELIAIWESCLSAGEISVDANFLELGGDSLGMIRAVNAINDRCNCKLTFNDFVSMGTIQHLAAFIDEHQLADETQLTHVEAKEPDWVHRYEPFPLTDLQMAYLIGRNKSISFGGIGTQAFYEIETSLDVAKLEEAFNKMIVKNPMLRTVFSEQGTQRILEDIPKMHIPVEDLTGMEMDKIENYLLMERKQYQNVQFDISTWPLFVMRAYKISEDRYRIFTNFDLLICDGISMRILINQLIDYYDKSEPTKETSFTFRDYVMARKSEMASDRYVAAKEYWQGKMEDMPECPQLPMKAVPETVVNPKFKRVLGNIRKEKWQQIKADLAPLGITPSAYLLNAYGAVLGRYSGKDAYTINLTIFNRTPFHPDVEAMVGDFSSIMLVDISEDGENRAENCRNLQKTMLEGLEHDQYSGVQFSQHIAKQKKRSNELLFPIVFTSMLFSDKYNLSIDKLGKTIYSVSQTSQVYLDCQVMENDGDLVISWDYVEQLYDADMMEEMFGQFLALVNRPEKECEIPDTSAKRISEYNNSDAAFPQLSMFGRLKEHAMSIPDHIAVKDQSGQMTYRELDQLSDKAACLLYQRGVRKGDTVGVYSIRNRRTAVNLLAVLKVGAAYVPVDMSYPEERVQYIFDNSKCKTWVDDTFVGEAEDYAAEKDLDLGFMTEPAPDDVAYIIYTSGSTGRPKGVVMTHGQVMNTIIDINHRFSVTQKDCIIGLSAFSFDLSVYDIFGAVHSGAMVYIAENNTDMGMIDEIVRNEGITIWNTVPAIMNLYMNTNERQEPNFWDMGENSVHVNFDQYSKLRKVLLSGDYIPVELPERIRKKFVGAEVISLGGATEGAIWSIYYPISHVDPSWSCIPYGYPLNNQKMYIIDEKQRLCPVGVRGEIAIGGAGVAVGYCNDPEKTDKAFIQHPKLGRLYKTGDQGIFSKEGYIEFCGRVDNQVKINGYRVELEEIEAAIKDCLGIQDAKVVRSSKNKNTLVGFYTSQDEQNDEKIKEHIGEKLPAYMIPSYFKRIEEVPLSGNGKVDVKRLESIAAENTGTQVLIPPRDDKEKDVAAAFQDVLECGEVTVQDNFYELGADSVKTIELYNILKQGYQVEIGDIFKYQTVEAIAKSIEKVEDAMNGRLEMLRKQYEELMEDHTGYDHIEKSYEAYLKTAEEDTARLSIERERQFSDVLLLGGTGYLGSYLLKDLLTRYCCNVYILLRGKKDDQYLKTKFAFYFPEMQLDQYRDRITILNGDVKKPLLGWDEKTYQSVSGKVDTIFNCAGEVGHFGDEQHFHQVNVESVRTLCQLATTGKAKSLHHMSTTRLMESDNEKEFSLYTEDAPIEKKTFSDIYTQTKYEAEKIIEEYRGKGCNANIYRIGTIVFDSNNGKFQENIDSNAFYLIMKSFFNLGVIPDFDFDIIDFSFVDYVSRAILLLALQGREKQNYHILNNNKISTSMLYELLKQAGMKENMEKHSFDDFYNMMYEKYGDDSYREHIDTLLLHSEAYMSVEGITSVKLSDRTDMILEKMGFSWPSLSQSHLINMLDYGREIGFFEEVI